MREGVGGGNYLLFGATGMVGQGVLRECLRGPAVRRVVAVGRSASGLAVAQRGYDKPILYGRDINGL